MKKKDYLILILLAILPLLLVFMIVPDGYLFGNKVDWLSQHTVIPNYFRQLFYSSGNLFPDFAFHLGGGANIYAFSYYGLFRPDILIAYLLPNVDMMTIILDYTILMMSLGACLCYIWLRNKSYPRSICLLASILLICSSFFYHAHKQIMFVNYIPFLFMAFLSIDYYIRKQKSTWLILSILLIILHSYFFSIAAMIICCIYYLYELSLVEKLTFRRLLKKDTRKFVFSIMIAIMIACILLIPTALVILENTKSVADTKSTELLSLSLDLKGLLYNRYGCGFTMIAWICIVLGLQDKKTRILSLILIVSFTLPIVYYLLNGTLYARTKILIVFIPIVLLVIANSLNQIRKKELKWNPYLLPLVILPILFIQDEKHLLLFDLIITVLLLILYIYHKKPQVLLIMTMIPLFYLTQANSKNDFLSNKRYMNAVNDEKENLIEQFSNELDGRTDDFNTPLVNANRLYSLNEYKTTSYTSTNNSMYNSFYYDIMKNPISIANRVANLANSNIFFQGFMGVKTIYTNTKIPIGYEVIGKNDRVSIAQNNNVLPIAYATSQLIEEESFDKLAYPYSLDTIYNNAVVKHKSTTDYQSKMQKETLHYKINFDANNLILDTKENSVLIKAKKNTDIEFKLNNNLSNKILMISFDVKDIAKAKTRETKITINEITNKLSKGNAAYPNGNTHFTYILSSNETIEDLKIRLSKGNYTLENIQVYSLDYDVIKNRKQEVTPLVSEQTSNKEVIKGSIQTIEDGYFITSLPYQKGYKVFVDGKEIEPEIVNKAFLGFPLESGKHSIRIEFHAPGKTLGTCISIFGVALLIINFIIERGKKNG